MASLAFTAITRTHAGSPERQQVLGLAFIAAWALACAAVAVVATFLLPIVNLLFGWSRMSASALEGIAQWCVINIWSMLPQALMAGVFEAFDIDFKYDFEAYFLRCVRLAGDGKCCFGQPCIAWLVMLEI